MARTNQSKTLCWDCDNVYFDKCPWMREENPSPVTGWTAKKTKEGYSVKACPLFVKAQEHAPCDEGVRNLVYAVINRTARDYLFSLSDRRSEAKPPIMTKHEIEKWADSADSEELLGDVDAKSILASLRRGYADFCVSALTHWNDEPNEDGEVRFTCPVCGADGVIKERHVKGLKRRVKIARCGCGCEYTKEGINVS